MLPNQLSSDVVIDRLQSELDAVKTCRDSMEKDFMENIAELQKELNEIEEALNATKSNQ